MTPTSMQTLSEWHQEIAAELVQTEAELAPALEELRVAQAEVRKLDAAYRDLAAVAPAITARMRGDIASAIEGRLTKQRALLDPARGRVARAAGTVKGLRERIGELKRALLQLEQVLPAETEVAA